MSEVVIDWAMCNQALRDLCKAAYENSKAHGFWDQERNLPEMLCLMHSEITEVLEEIRGHQTLTNIYYTNAGKPNGVPIELADLLIRVFDFAGGMGINLCEAIKLKSDYNAKRPYKHGKTC